MAAMAVSSLASSGALALDEPVVGFTVPCATRSASIALERLRIPIANTRAVLARLRTMRLMPEHWKPTSRLRTTSQISSVCSNGINYAIPWGGGGLACGIGAAIRARSQGCGLFAAEAETGAPLAAALAAGQPVPVDYRPSFVDGIGSRQVFPQMLERARTLLDGSIVVSLAEVASAVRILAERAHVVAEGAGACAIAAAMSGRAGKGKVVCVVSGGNIDLDLYASLLAGRQPA